MAQTSSSGIRAAPPDAASSAANPYAAPDGFGAAPGRAGDYADFPARVGAYLVDLLMVGLMASIPTQVIQFVLSTASSFERARYEGVARIGNLILGMSLALIYHVVLETSARQGTLGKQVLGLVVTDLRGRRISVVRAVLRYVARYLSLLCCGMGYLLPLFTSRKQTLHDVLSGCVVIRK